MYLLAKYEYQITEKYYFTKYRRIITKCKPTLTITSPQTKFRPPKLVPNDVVYLLAKYQYQITEKYLFIKYRRKIAKCKPALKITSPVPKFRPPQLVPNYVVYLLNHCCFYYYYFFSLVGSARFWWVIHPIRTNLETVVTKPGTFSSAVSRCKNNNVFTFSQFFLLLLEYM